MERIIIGVDTHESEHVAVAITIQGARVARTAVPATRDAYRGL
ncbi:hypothetical protein [Rhodobacter sp. CZR27]|nr:hypothetical protein [Rhodobacter sp. CZR27]